MRYKGSVSMFWWVVTATGQACAKPSAVDQTRTAHRRIAELQSTDSLAFQLLERAAAPDLQQSAAACSRAR